MATYENPANGYREEVSRISILWAVLFGFFYFAIKGAWAYALLAFLIAPVSAAAWFIVFVLTKSNGLGLIAAFAVWLAYAWAAPDVIGRRYLRAGWRQVD